MSVIGIIYKTTEGVNNMKKSMHYYAVDLEYGICCKLF